MIEFNSVFENNNTLNIIRRYYLYSNIIYQPVLSNIFYYKNNEGYEGNTALWDKLIKREIVFKALNHIGKKYLYKRVIIENDVIILFVLFKIANSFQYIDELGYYYILLHNDSITKTKYDDTNNANQIIYSIFFLLLHNSLFFHLF